MLMKRWDQGKFVVEDLTSLNECNYKISAKRFFWEGVFGVLVCLEVGSCMHFS